MEEITILENQIAIMTALMSLAAIEDRLWNEIAITKLHERIRYTEARLKALK